MFTPRLSAMLTAILVFTVGDLIGRFAPELSFLQIRQGRRGTKTVFFMSFLRFALFPLVFLALLISRFEGSNGWKLLVMLFMALTNGFVCTQSFVHGPPSVAYTKRPVTHH